MDPPEPRSGALATMVPHQQPFGNRTRTPALLRSSRPTEIMSTPIPSLQAFPYLTFTRTSLPAKSALPRGSGSPLQTIFTHRPFGPCEVLVPPLQPVPHFPDTATTGLERNTPRPRVDTLLVPRRPKIRTPPPTTDARVLPSSAACPPERIAPGQVPLPSVTGTTDPQCRRQPGPRATRTAPEARKSTRFPAATPSG